MKIFNEQHEMFRATVRSFVDKEIAPHIEEWEAAGRMPRWIWPRMGELGCSAWSTTTSTAAAEATC